MRTNPIYTNIPHACFYAALRPRDARVLLLQSLEMRLLAKFSGVRHRRTWLRSGLIIFVQSDTATFVVSLMGSKYANQEWVLVVVPPTSQKASSSLFPEDSDHNDELMRLCREIHEVLTKIPLLKSIRWYFDGYDSQLVAVSTPDELNWAHLRQSAE